MLIDLNKRLTLLGSSSLANSITAELGYKSWKRSPNVIYLETAADLAPLLQPANAEYPNGYYEIPADQSLAPEATIEHTLPIVAESGGFIGCGLIPTQKGTSTLKYTGGLGNGPVSFGVDAGIVGIDEAIINSGVTIENGVLGVLGVAMAGPSQNATYFSNGAAYNCKTCFGIGDNAGIISSGRNIVFGQASASAVLLGGGESASLNLDGFLYNVGNFNASDFFDLTSADPGTLNVTVARCTADPASGKAFLKVTDDNTIDQGSVTDNVLDSASLGDFILGIDETSVNTLFDGNEGFNNTKPNIELNISANLTATLDPGDTATWVNLAGVFGTGGEETWFDQNGNTLPNIRLIKNITDRYRGNTSGSIVRASGGASTLITLGAFLNAEVTPFKTVPVTISNVPVAIPGLLTEKQLTEDDVVTYKVQWTGGNGFNILIPDFTAVWD